MVLEVNGPWLLGMGTGLNHRHTVGAVGTVQAVGSPPQAPPEGQREISVIAPKGTVSQCPIPLGTHVDEKASTPGLMHNTEFHYIAHLFKTDPDPGHAAALDKVIGDQASSLSVRGRTPRSLSPSGQPRNGGRASTLAVQLQQMEMESRFNMSSPRVAASAMFELSEEKASLRPVCFVIARLISLSLVPAAKLVGPASPSGVAPLLSSNGLPEWLILAPSCLFPANGGPVLGVCSCLPPPAARLTHWARRSHPSLSPSLAHPI